MTQPKQTPSRKARHFFCDTPLGTGQTRIFLSEKETKHLRQVLRLKEGDSCFVLDGEGCRAQAVIASFITGKAQLEVMRIESMQKSPAIQLHLYVALPQKGKIEFLIEKAQELGVFRFCPLETKRTVVNIPLSKQPKVMGRWEKTAREAAKQSISPILMKVDPPQSLSQAMKNIAKEEPKAIFHPSQASLPFQEWISSVQSKLRQESGQPCPWHLFIGPEGGFEDQEVSLAQTHGAVQVGLGSQILKVDTAFIGVVAALKLLL